MEKRERVRRDRRRDGKRNTFQNEQAKEIVKQHDSSVEEKKNDAQNVEVSNKKNTAEDKDKAIEDDPLRFANLKRETDEIAALKAKKPHKRQVFSNWSKYEEPLPSLDESRAVDFETLLHAPQSGGFRFKSEQQWDTGSYGRFGELFTPDAELLVSGLSSLPFYLRLGIDKTLFLEDEIERMDTCAKENYVAYEKLSKSKPKRKVAATDLFKIDQAEKYSVVDQLNGPTVELSTSTSKPVFSVDEAPEATPTEPSLPSCAAGSSPEPNNRSRESTPATERAPKGTVREFHFEKPPSSSFGATNNRQSQTPDRDRTPLRDTGERVASPEFHFEKAPPPSYAYNNVKSPFHSRESTPAKETAPTTVSRGHGGSQVPISLGGSGRQAISREGTPDPAAPPVREREAKQNVRDDRRTVKGSTSTADVYLREGTPAREQQDDGALRENSPARKVTYKSPQVAPVASLEVKQSLDKIPANVETPDREEIPRERTLQRNGTALQEEPTHQNSSYESDMVSGQKMDENGQINTESDNYSKKRGKPDVRKQEGLQRGGGRHGRRKKGQNASARGGDQPHTEAGDVCGDTAEPEAEGTAPTAPKGTESQETRREEPRRADGAKKKPERPPPPAVLQQNRQQTPPPTPQPTSAPPVVQQAEYEAPQPMPPKPEEPKVQQVSKPVMPPEEPKVQQVSKPVMPPEEPKVQQVSKPVTPPNSQAQPPQRKAEVGTKVESIPKGRSSAGRVDDDGLNFLMSLRGQKTGGVSEVEAAKSAAGAAVSRSAIEEDEMKESQKPKPPPVITTEKKEDLEDWLDSMLDD